MTQGAREDDIPPASEMLPTGMLSVDPLRRVEAGRADVSFTEARLADAIDAGDAEAERNLSIELARKLAARGTDLHEALRLAERALAIQDDAALLSELSGWLGGVGEHARAAAALEHLAARSRSGRSSSRAYMRAAVLRARAGDALAARDDLTKAADREKTDPVPLELLGTLASWAESVVSRDECAVAYLEAAARRDAALDEEAAFEDRLRAFEACRVSRVAADSLAEALVARGRRDAAEEVLVAHAETLPAAARVRVHRTRLEEAEARGDVPRALSAVFDARAELPLGKDPDPELEVKVDEALSRAGMYELLAIRFAARAREQSGAAARATYESLARLYEGQLGRVDLMVDALIDAVVMDPEARGPRVALLDHAAKTGDEAPVIEALVRVATGKRDVTEAAIALVELAHYAEHDLADATLALWAKERLEQIGREDREGLLAARGRLEVAARQTEEQIAEHEAALAQANTLDDRAREARVSALATLARLYRSNPDKAARRLEILAALVRAQPTPEVWRAFAWQVDRELQRGASSVDRDPLASAITAALEAPVGAQARGAARLLLAKVVAASDPTGKKSLEAVKPLLDDASRDEGVDPWVAASVFEIATRAGALKERGRALSLLAAGPEAPLASVLLAAASSELAAAGDARAALAAAERAMRASPGSGVAARALAHAATLVKDRDSVAAFESAMSVLVPSIERCSAFAHALDIAGEPVLAFAWTQRWLALAPAHPQALRELCRRAVDLADATRLTSAIGWVLSQPEPHGPLVDALIDGLRALFAIDAAKAKPIARRTLDVVGPKRDSLRRELVALADEHGDKGLAIAALERSLATSREHDVAMLLELCVRRSEAQDFDGAARELCRAASAGTAPDAVLESVRDVENAAGNALSGDGKIWIAEAVARSHWEREGDRQAENAMAGFRELGALKWDLAEDWRGSERALFAASEATERFDLYAHDLVELAGLDRAIAAIRARARATQGKRRARVLTAAARQLAEQGQEEPALEMAEEALTVDPSVADAVAIAEACARGEHGAAVISRIYDGLAKAAMGIYGQRAAHYRAARQLERRGALPLAVEHAIASFEAVPNEGTSYHLLTRLIDRTGDFADAIRALERVAESAKPEQRGLWLNRAAALTPGSPDGLAARYDLLLRALLVQPESKTVAHIEDTVLALIKGGDDGEHAKARFERALRSALTRLEGPDGAFVSIRLARAAVALDMVELAFAALQRAVRVDAGHGAFKDLAPVVDRLATRSEPAATFVSRVMESQTAGPEALAVALTLAEHLGDKPATVRLAAKKAEAEAPPPVMEMETFDLTDDEPAPPPSVKVTAAQPPVEPAAGPESILGPESLVESLAPPALTGALLRRGGSGVRPHAPELTRSDPSPSIESALLESTTWSIPTSDKMPTPADPAATLHEEPPAAEPPVDEARARAEQAEAELSRATEAGGGAEAVAAAKSAAALWDKLAKDPSRPQDERVEFGLKAVYGFTVAKDSVAALDALERISAQLSPELASELRVGAARASGDPLALTLALDELAAVKPFESETDHARVYLEAAQAALVGGDEAGALIRARRAARLDPSNGVAAIEVARLEYRTRGTGTPREAQATVDALVAIDSVLPPDLVELHGFLLAEELDVIQGGGAGMRELTHRHAEVGPLPLIALGMAERLARNRSYEAALPLFEKAIAGDLRGLRNPGRVAAAATDAAIQAGALDLATRLLEEAERYPDTRATVERRRRELVAASPDPEIAAKALEELIVSSAGLARARFLDKLAMLKEEQDPEAAIALYEQALGVARNDRALSDKIRKSLVFLRSRGIDTTGDDEVTSTGKKMPIEELMAEARVAVIPPKLPPPLPAPTLPKEPALRETPRPTEASPAQPAAEVDDTPEAPPSGPRIEVSSGDVELFPVAAVSEGRMPAVTDHAPTPATGPTHADEESAPVSRMPASRALAARWPSIERPEEEDLFLRLISGVPEAGDELIALYKPNRTRDVLVVRRHQAAMRTGNRATLEALHEAALADGSAVYARAVEHVLTVGRTAKAPPLSGQTVTPEMCERLLFRDLANPTTEVLGLVWESGLMRKDAAAAGLAGATRIVPGVGNPVSEALAILLPAFGPRPLYHVKQAGSPRLSLALLSSPSIVYEGDLRALEEPELLYRLAACAAGGVPEFTIVAGEEEAKARLVVEAVVGAFGPVGAAEPPSSTSGTSKAAIARIGAELWQRVQPAAERRLRALTSETQLSFDEAKNATEMAMRRAGLFASGDLGVSIAMVLNPDEPNDVPNPDDLEELCKTRAEVADIVRLALRMEYAEARFYTAPSSVPSGRRPGAQSRA